MSAPVTVGWFSAYHRAMAVPWSHGRSKYTPEKLWRIRWLRAHGCTSAEIAEHKDLCVEAREVRWILAGTRWKRR